MLSTQQEATSKRVADRLWRLLPRDDAERRLDKIANEIRQRPDVDQDLLDLAIDSIKRNLDQLGKCGHA